MQQSSPSSLFSSIPALTAAGSNAASASVCEHEDRYLWELLHLSDHHKSDSRIVSDEGLKTLSQAGSDKAEASVTVGSPDWVFICGEWNPRVNSALLLRDSKIVVAIQKDAGQLRLSTFDFLSARLIEALFELGVDARVEEGIGERFWKRAETVAWRLGLGTIGYALEPFSANVSDQSELKQKAQRLLTLSNDALPSSFGARQLRILYKYG